MGWLLRISIPERSDRSIGPARHSDDRDEPDDPEHADESERLASQLWDLGTTGLFHPVPGETVAGFDTEELAAAAAAALTNGPADQNRVTSIEPAPPPSAWAGADADQARPVPFTVNGQTIQLLIETGAAFGHGQHPTTRLALDLLARHIEPGHRVLDVGTGTGVLAIAAAAAGAGSVVGIDNDPEAVSVAGRNLATNRRLIAATPIACGLWTVDEARQTLGGPADLVVMNVLLPTQRQLAEPVTTAMSAQGLLITAGYLDNQATELTDLYGGQHDLTAVAHDHCDGWAAAVFRAGRADASAVGY